MFINYREWAELTPGQAEYLVQARGPHDMFQHIVRDIATVTSISNAAILYDDTFMMDHSYRNLLINMPIRYGVYMFTSSCPSETMIFRQLTRKLESDDLTTQIKTMIDLEAKNFFILARYWNQ